MKSYSISLLLLVILSIFGLLSINTNGQDGFVMEEDEATGVDDVDNNNNNVNVDIDDNDNKMFTNKALVLVHQYIITDTPAENQKLTFRYIIMNVGGVDALNVKFTLPDFPTPVSSELDENGVELGNIYTIIDGSASASVDSLAPGQKYSVDFTIIPKKPFSFTSKMSAGKVEYRYGNADPPAEKIGSVSSMGTFDIISARKYSKMTINEPLRWIPFALVAIGSVIYPFSTWYSIYKKNEINYPTKMN